MCFPVFNIFSEHTKEIWPSQWLYSCVFSLHEGNLLITNYSLWLFPLYSLWLFPLLDVCCKKKLMGLKELIIIAIIKIIAIIIINGMGAVEAVIVQ